MSPQTDYSQNMPVAVAGLQVDSRHDNFVVSGAAEEIMRFGLAAVRKAADAEVVRLPGANQVAILEDGGTYTAGSFIIVVNGVTLTVAYNTDKATTLGDVATAIAALGFVASAAYAANTITIVAEADVYLAVSVDISGITGTMTITSTTYSSTDELMGLAMREVKSLGSIRSTWNDRALMTLSGDALAANDTVDGQINGVAIAQVTYATSEANTLQLVANAIKAIAGVVDAVVSGRTISITNNPGLEITASLTVDDDTVASVSPTFAATYSQQDLGVGLAEAAYLPSETVNVVRRGSVWMKVEEAIALGDSVFMRVATGTGSQRGALRNDVDSGTCVAVTALRFAGASVSDPNGDLLAPVEVNLP